MDIGYVEAVLATSMMVALGLIILSIKLRKHLGKMFGWMDRRGWIKYSGDPGTRSYGTLANSLMGLQAIGDPRQQYVLEEKLKDEAEEDDEGGPDKAGGGQRRGHDRDEGGDVRGHAP